MGLDCGLVLKILERDTNQFVECEIFYFRKNYSLSKRLQESALYFKDYAKNLEYDGEYGITLDLNTHLDVVWEMASRMAAEMDAEVIDFLQGINEIDRSEDEFEFDSIWDVGGYIRNVNAAALQIHSLYLFLRKKITFETLADICEFDVEPEIIDEPDKFDFDHMELEFYYSY